MTIYQRAQFEWRRDLRTVSRAAAAFFGATAFEARSALIRSSERWPEKAEKIGMYATRVKRTTVVD
jgi:hypothetical protein